jgi:hypothetical protein
LIPAMLFHFEVGLFDMSLGSCFYGGSLWAISASG